MPTIHKINQDAEMETALPHTAPATDLPNGWRMVRFGDIVRNVDIAVRDREAAGIERIVGLDHLDPELLHIKRWNSIAEGTSFTRKFTTGQVLFGKRRSYQRKVAVAEFDGICSGDILVFEPKGDALLPELLPFIVQSDGFFDHALGTSAGSLSPRTRWRDLAEYRFPLPPRDEQRRIAELLWAADEAVEANTFALDELQISVDIWIEETIKKGKTGTWAENTLGEILDNVQYGSSLRSSAHTANAVPILRIPNVVQGNLDLTDLAWVEMNWADQERYKVQPTDILIVRTNGNPLYVGRSCLAETAPDKAVYASYLIRLRTNLEVARPKYVDALINSKYLRPALRREIKSSAGNYNLNTQGIKKQKIPLPSLQEQDAFLNTLEAFRVCKSQLALHIHAARNMKSQLLKNLLIAPVTGHQSIETG